ncbi:efflux RND transporter permease subunit [Vibrio sp. SS-MA-C1-2]|uniref:efflux RND transporter permease subunit n=1 Tax=Vibrio sp. SS-MA-C1-2 TaxID=2908646 RepID=UPI002883222D|nr:efflux RND transporter permease subunit [Vibrio sp. SS-MA-C1-2]
MMNKVIDWAISNRFLVCLATLFLLAAGYFSVRNIAVDAIPDLSEVQVIVKTSYPGQAPQVVEDQVTYPLTTAMLSVPKAKTVRGFSFFGDSYVYIIFDEGTDMYWARSRVLEYLSQVASKLPASATPQLGPDATGVGWIYEYALVDESGKHNLADLRSLQDFYLKYQLQSVSGVSEIATVGGMVKQYQVDVDPNKLRAYGISLKQLSNAVKSGNLEAGASVIEMAEAEYMVRTDGYISSIKDIKHIPLLTNKKGVPITIGDVADVRLGPQMRRGVADLDGQGEVVGGIVVMRSGENAQKTIDAVKEKLTQLEKGLPDGVKVVTTYDRSSLIKEAQDELVKKLIEEIVVVAVICGLFLWHLRSTLVVILTLPVGILTAYIVMYYQGVNANIMSLGGIGIAIGAMVDGAIVMVENLHKHMEMKDDRTHWQKVGDSCKEVASPLFFSLLIITVSFIPVFALQGQSGKLFHPLAFTKSYAMAASAGLAVTLVPVLLGFFVRGKIISEEKNPLNRLLIASYRPLLKASLKHPFVMILIAVSVTASAWYPLQRIGSEFMPPMDEGDLMYMPSTYAGISVGKAREIVQQTDRLIKTVPEVKSVFGKVGRAETATDPAPLTMIETTIQFKPKSEWREGMTKEKLKQELNRLVKIPGLSNAWVEPIKTRIDMLSTGIKTPVGIKIAGTDLAVIEKVGQELEKILPTVPGTASAYAERAAGGRYVNIDINRSQAARYGLNIADVQQIIQTAVGGMNVTTTVEGIERYPVNIRYSQSYRDSDDKLKLLPIVTPLGQHITLSDIADVSIQDGPPAIKTENAIPNGWVFVSLDQGVDVGSYVQKAQAVVNEQLKLPAGYSLNWSGQYEYMQKSAERLKVVIPVTIAVIFILLYLNFRSIGEVALVMLSLPFALVGGVWYLYVANYNYSVAVAVGFIATAGLVVEIGVLMLTYLENAKKDHLKQMDKLTVDELKLAIIEGASKRVRPIIMTVATVVVGLFTVMSGTGAGAETMRRIAVPMIGGMGTALFLTLLLLPALYFLWQKQKIKHIDSIESKTSSQGE